MNTVSLVGRLAVQPKHSPQTADSKARSWFVLAVERSQNDQADFIPVTCFGRGAETVAKYVDKGRLVAVSGHIHSSTYDDYGTTRRNVEVIADRVEFLGRRPVADKDVLASAEEADADGALA